MEDLSKLKNIQEPILNKGQEGKQMVSRNNDFSLNKYVFGLVLVDLTAKIPNAQERGHQGHG